MRGVALPAAGRPWRLSLGRSQRTTELGFAKAAPLNSVCWRELLLWVGRHVRSCPVKKAQGPFQEAMSTQAPKTEYPDQ